MTGWRGGRGHPIAQDNLSRTYSDSALAAFRLLSAFHDLFCGPR